MTGQPLKDKQSRAGFALMGVLVTVAVIAILAGVLGPMAYRQMMEKRVEDTRQEMLAIESALLSFFQDTGRFPLESEGLAALTENPGVSGWQGPYLSGVQFLASEEIEKDGFGENYVYDLQPAVTPGTSCDVLLVSGGSDNTISTGALNLTWNLANVDNDLLVFVDADRVNRTNISTSQEEMQTIAEAASRYFQDNAEFPASLNDLLGTHLDASFSGQALTDPWLNNYAITVDNNATPPTLVISSFGPDGSAGGGDDIQLAVDSVVPGRRATQHLLQIAQVAVNANPGLNLTGNWDVDLVTLNLSSALATDGWGKLFEEAMSTRTILSAGPDGDYFTPSDNIPPGVVPDDLPAGGAGGGGGN